MYSVNSARRPRNRSRENAHAAGAPTSTCPSTWGNTMAQVFQNMVKNCGVSNKSSASGWSVGQLGSRGQKALPSAPCSTGPSAARSSSKGISAPVPMNHNGHHTASAGKRRNSTSTARPKFFLFIARPPRPTVFAAAE